jgi:pyruvate,water dikinase
VAALPDDIAAPHGLVRRVRGRAALDLDALKRVAASLPGGSAEAVEHGFFGNGGRLPNPPRGARLRSARHDLRVDAARRRAVHEAGVVVLAAARLAAEHAPLDRLGPDALLGRRRRLVDLAWRAMAAELGVAAAATAAYDRLESFVAAHLPGGDAARWAQRVTTGIATATPPTTASMSVFAGVTWDEAGVEPPVPPGGRRGGADALTELEAVLRALPRWRATRILTGQVVDVRLHLLRRLTADAVSLLGWRERAKVAVLSLGGEVRSVHRALASRLVADGLLAAVDDVDLLTDAELRGDDPVPSRVALARRRRALLAAVAAGALPERFTGCPPPESVPAPAGDRLRGIGASGGRWTGRARVVRDPRSAKLRSGEVLVAETTDAGWSPLFVEAGAVVVERGGPLSHAAIVARELGVPAVLDVHGATSALDGRTVTVDGDDGVVIVHGEPGR